MRTGDDTSLDYVQRVNRTIDHVLQNLDQPLRLEDVARVACFSPFHFHRVFRALLGETLAQFVKRLRLERALALLSHGKDASLTGIALRCGLENSAACAVGCGASATTVATRATRTAARRGLNVIRVILAIIRGGCWASVS